jgi:hypothetical protein
MNTSTHQTIPVIGAPVPERPSISQRTHDFIEAHIKGLLASGKEDEDVIKAVRKLHLLPLDSAEGERLYGVRPDGDLLSFNRREPYEEKEEEDRWQRTSVLKKGSGQYPELNPLIPPPPLSRSVCPQCGGTGTVLQKGELSWCICEGVGWWPALNDEVEKGDEDRDPKEGY